MKFEPTAPKDVNHMHVTAIFVKREIGMTKLHVVNKSLYNLEIYNPNNCGIDDDPWSYGLKIIFKAAFGLFLYKNLDLEALKK